MLADNAGGLGTRGQDEGNSDSLIWYLEQRSVLHAGFWISGFHGECLTTDRRS